MKKKSFMKFKLYQAILAGVLVILVFVNLVITYKVNTRQSPLWQENIEMKEEKAKLESINKALYADAIARLLENKEMKHFLGDMETEITGLIQLTQCVDCCGVAGKLIKMSPRLIHFEKMINYFTREKGAK